VLLLLLFHCHFFACLFYLVATEEGRYESNWFAVTQAAKPGHGSADTLARWLFAYYWAIVTFATIGYGDIVPVSNRECVHSWQWRVWRERWKPAAHPVRDSRRLYSWHA
jgi:Ion channel